MHFICHWLGLKTHRPTAARAQGGEGEISVKVKEAVAADKFILWSLHKPKYTLMTPAVLYWHFKWMMREKYHPPSTRGNRIVYQLLLVMTIWQYEDTDDCPILVPSALCFFPFKASLARPTHQKLGGIKKNRLSYIIRGLVWFDNQLVVTINNFHNFPPL